MNEISDEKSVIDNEDQRRRVELFGSTRPSSLPEGKGRADRRRLRRITAAPAFLERPFWLTTEGREATNVEKNISCCIIHVPQRSGATR